MDRQIHKRFIFGHGFIISWTGFVTCECRNLWSQMPKSVLEVACSWEASHLIPAKARLSGLHREQIHDTGNSQHHRIHRFHRMPEPPVNSRTWAKTDGHAGESEYESRKSGENGRVIHRWRNEKDPSLHVSDVEMQAHQDHQEKSLVERPAGQTPANAGNGSLTSVTCHEGLVGGHRVDLLELCAPSHSPRLALGIHKGYIYDLLTVEGYKRTLRPRSDFGDDICTCPHQTHHLWSSFQNCTFHVMKPD